MKRNEFEKLTAEGYEKLPEWVRHKIRTVAFLIEDEPSEEVRVRERLGHDETLLGYYHGIPLSERGEHYGVGETMPDTITLYQSSIEDAAAETLSDAELGDESAFREAVRKEVADTIWHEFAHHFGMDEHEVRLRESKRGIE